MKEIAIYSVKSETIKQRNLEQLRSAIHTELDAFFDALERAEKPIYKDSWDVQFTVLGGQYKGQKFKSFDRG